MEEIDFTPILFKLVCVPETIILYGTTVLGEEQCDILRKYDEQEEHVFQAS
jgi:hypothetical protein